MKLLDPAALELAGTTVIEASAGTGKTYTITTLVLRLLLEANLTVDQVLVMTYTRAATAELRDRIRGRLRVALACARGNRVDDPFVATLIERARAAQQLAALDERLERALFDVDNAPVLTIHGFCQRVLSEHAFESDASPDVTLTSHAAPLLEEIVDDYYVRELHDASQERVAALAGNERERLLALAQRTAHDRSLRVLPEHAPEPSFDRSVWQRAYERCQQLWRTDREQIVALVSVLPKMNASHLAGWVSKWSRTLTRAQPGLPKDFEKALESFTTRSIAARVAGSKKVAVAPVHAFFAAAEALFDAEQLFLAAARAATLGFRRKFVDYVGRELELRTRRDELRTFDALLHDLDRAVEGARGQALIAALRSSYRAVLVDEFQDTDPTQYRIFRRVFGESTAPLFLIGDPKQAIYGFRGADVFAYMKARTDAGERVYTLDVNRRSDPELIAAMNQLYTRVQQPFLLEGIDYHAVRAPETARSGLRAHDRGAPLQVLVVQGDSASELRKEIAERVASELVRLLESGCERNDGQRMRRLAPRDVAVLCRENREALLIQEALSKRGVPSVFQGDQSVFESEDAVEIERVLTALARPGDVRALRSFLCSFYAGQNAHALVSLEDDDEAWDRHRATFQSLHDAWLEHGFMQALRGLVLAYDVERTLLARHDGTRRITNLWHLVELLSAAQLEQRLGPLGLVRFLQLVRHDEALRDEASGESHELRLESSEDAVKLTTVHKSKGLEYPVVFCPFAWDARTLRNDDKTFVRFHDPEAHGELTLDLGSAAHADHLELAKREALAETLRLVYVALTRAKHRVYVVSPTGKTCAGSALAYTLFGGGEPEGLSKRVAALEPSEAVAELCAHIPELARLLPEPSDARLSPLAGSGRALSVRSVRRKLETGHRTSSFSALASSAPSHQPDSGRDHDLREDDVEQAPSEALPLAGFPGGAKAGEVVHAVLEHADFCAGDAALREVCKEVVVDTYRYAPALVEVLAQGLSRTLATPLDTAGLSLGVIARAQRLDELEFLLPVAGSLTPNKLANVFREHKAPRALPSYHQALRTLGFNALSGFLRGFIDLVFAHDGRFFVVDYKSNRLGSRPAHYGDEAMCDAMLSHHYFLQYHVYTLAVHRYLRMRVADYDYDRHFGGVYYLFLRGMAPEYPAGSGVFFDRPSRALVEALDHALGAARGDAA